MIVAPVGQALADVGIREFLHEATTLTNGKGRHVVPMMRVLAGHIGVEALKAVGEPLLDQLVQRAVDGGRRDGPFAPHLVKNLIGRERILGGAQNPVNPLLGLVQVLEAVVVMRGNHLKSSVPLTGVIPLYVMIAEAISRQSQGGPVGPAGLSLCQVPLRARPRPLCVARNARTPR